MSVSALLHTRPVVSKSFDIVEAV